METDLNKDVQNESKDGIPDGAQTDLQSKTQDYVQYGSQYGDPALQTEPEESKKPSWELPPKKAYTRTGFAILAFVLLFNLVVIGAELVLFSVFKLKSISIETALLLNLLGEVGVALPVYLLVIKKIPSYKPEKKKMGAGNFLAAICMMYAVSIAGSFIASLINSIILSSAGVSSDSSIGVFFDNGFVFTAIFSVIIAPVVEELVFRKFLIDKLRVYSEKNVILLSGLSFALMHGNVEQFFYAFFIGLLFAFIYVRTGKIRYTITLHFIMNGVSTLLVYLMSKVSIFDDLANLTDEMLIEKLLKDEKGLIMFMLVALVALTEYVMAFIGLILLIVRKKRFFLVRTEYDADAKTAFGNIGVAAAIVVMIGFIILGMYL